MEARLLDENTNLGPNVRAAPASADSPRVPASPVVARPVIAAERRGARNSAGALPTCLALACIPALFFALIIALPWEGPLIHELHRNTTLLEDDLPLATPTYTRSVEHFHSHGTRCGAWLYLPLQPTAAPPPPGERQTEVTAVYVLLGRYYHRLCRFSLSSAALVDA